MHNPLNLKCKPTYKILAKTLIKLTNSPLFYKKCIVYLDLLISKLNKDNSSNNNKFKNSLVNFILEFQMDKFDSTKVNNKTIDDIQRHIQHTFKLLKKLVGMGINQNSNNNNLNFNIEKVIID